MPVTITAGVTFSGGMDMTFAPPVVGTAGWFSGAFGPGTCTVDRITFATDTATSSVRGSTLARYKGAGTGTMTAGWFGSGVAGSTNSSSVDRITYATDTAASSARGPLSAGGYGGAAVSDITTYGWWIGGSYRPGRIDRITFANDTATATVRGPLAANKYNLSSSATDGATYGWVVGGLYSTTNVQRITYATDTDTASIRGPLGVNSLTTYAGVSSTTYGWFGGGYNSSPSAPFPSRVSIVQRITFANDTATGTTRGPLSLARELAINGVYDGTYAWFGGGYNGIPGAGAVYYTTTDRMTFATDTTTASGRGPLTQAHRYGQATSGIQ